MTQKLHDYLKSKQRMLIVIHPEASLREAATLIADQHVGSLPVLYEERIVGIITERDLVTQVASSADLDEIQVQDVMTRNVITGQPEQKITEAISMMVKSNVHHLPVAEDGQIVSTVSLRELVEAAYAEDEQEIRDLNEYMFGPSLAMTA